MPTKGRVAAVPPIPTPSLNFWGKNHVICQGNISNPQYKWY